jgi:hypothetical protein
MIGSAPMVLLIALVLMLAADKLLAGDRLKRRLGEETCRRYDGIVHGLLQAVIGCAFLLINIDACRAGRYEGVRMGVIARAEHPYVFWTLAVFFFPSSIVFVGWGISEFLQSLKARLP